MNKKILTKSTLAAAALLVVIILIVVLANSGSRAEVSTRITIVDSSSDPAALPGEFTDTEIPEADQPAAASPEQSPAADGDKSSTAALTPADEWQIVWLKSDDKKSHSGIEFHKNSVKQFSLEFKHPHDIGFMLPADLQHDPAAAQRCFTYRSTADKKDFNYRDYLVDMTGSGEKRYLIVANFRGGQIGFDEYGYLLDAKDNFAIVGRIPVGQTCDYPMPNDKLIFCFDEEIAYFGTWGRAAVSVKMQLKKGKAAICVAPGIDQQTISLKKYQDLKQQNCPKDIIFAHLYCDLASAGLLQQSRRYALNLGFTYDDIYHIGTPWAKKIRISDLAPHIIKLNNL